MFDRGQLSFCAVLHTMNNKTNHFILFYNFYRFSDLLYPPSEWSETGGDYDFTCVCVSVCLCALSSIGLNVTKESLLRCGVHPICGNSRNDSQWVFFSVIHYIPCCCVQFLGTLLITMQLVQQVQESLLPYLVYKLRRIRIRTHYFAVNTGTDRSCVTDNTLLRGEVEKSKDEYQVLFDQCTLTENIFCSWNHIHCHWNSSHSCFFLCRNLVFCFSFLDYRNFHSSSLKTKPKNSSYHLNFYNENYTARYWSNSALLYRCQSKKIWPTLNQSSVDQTWSIISNKIGCNSVDNPKWLGGKNIYISITEMTFFM